MKRLNKIYLWMNIFLCMVFINCFQLAQAEPSFGLTTEGKLKEGCMYIKDAPQFDVNINVDIEFTDVGNDEAHKTAAATGVYQQIPVTSFEPKDKDHALTSLQVSSLNIGGEEYKFMDKKIVGKGFLLSWAKENDIGKVELYISWASFIDRYLKSKNILCRESAK